MVEEKHFLKLSATYLKARLNLLSWDSDVNSRYSESASNLGISAEDALLVNARDKTVSWR